MDKLPSIRIVTDGEGGESIEINFRDYFVSINREKDGSFDKIIFKDCLVVHRDQQVPISHEHDGN